MRGRLSLRSDGEAGPPNTLRAVAPQRIVLASKSPQRKALLSSLGLEFRVIPSGVDEVTEGEPHQVVLANALAKARAVAARRRKPALVIAGDTEVVVDGRAIGQPAMEGEARWCLETLSGRTHEVLGALALIDPDPDEGEPAERTGVETSRVTFARLDPTLIDSYLASGEWRGRAGGYAVQGLGSALVSGIDGDVSNVIGLPIGLLLRIAPELAAAGR
jgi:septum formation protein